MSDDAIKAIKHPGPFLGPDVDLARACATIAVEWYGDNAGEELERIRRGEIWNDHVAVQAALSVIATLRALELHAAPVAWRWQMMGDNAIWQLLDHEPDLHGSIKDRCKVEPLYAVPAADGWQSELNALVAACSLPVKDPNSIAYIDGSTAAATKSIIQKQDAVLRAAYALSAAVQEKGQ